MKEQACMVTGHRKIQPAKQKQIQAMLRQEVKLAIENGYTQFMSGFADGIDLMFAEIIAELKDTYPIKLEAALPYPARVKTKSLAFHQLLSKCDVVKAHSKEYTPACFVIRNRYMVQHSSLVIAVYDGRDKGGTLATMRYAHVLKKNIHVISVNDECCHT